jgi:hypothetical protein
METLLLAWFVLVETGSVIWLTAFGGLQYVGTVISPLSLSGRNQARAPPMRARLPR